VPAFHERGARTERDECAPRSLHLIGRAHLASTRISASFKFGVTRSASGARRSRDQLLRITIEQPSPDVATITGSST